jgi:hypothetical protein
MKIYQIKYQQTEIFNDGGYNNILPFYKYDLVDKTEVIKTNDITAEIAKIKKRAESFKSSIFPNMKSKFVLKDVVLL